MRELITYLVIGEIADPPAGATVRYFPLVPKDDAAGLYRRRLQALASVRTPFFCFLDGAEDRLLPPFEACVASLVQRMQRADVCIGYMGEVEHGLERPGRPFDEAAYLQDFRFIHHGVIGRTQAFRRVAWPKGCYSFEVLGYGEVARRWGAVHEPEIGYAYNPAPTGARLWPSYLRAVNNSLAWLQGGQGVHTRAELGCSRCAAARAAVRRLILGDH